MAPKKCGNPKNQSDGEPQAKGGRQLKAIIKSNEESHSLIIVECHETVPTPYICDQEWAVGTIQEKDFKVQKKYQDTPIKRTKTKTMAGRKASARVFEDSQSAATHYQELVAPKTISKKARKGHGKKAVAEKTTEDSAEAAEGSEVVRDAKKSNVKVKNEPMDESRQETMSMANTAEESSMSVAEQAKEPSMSNSPASSEVKAPSSEADQ